MGGIYLSLTTLGFSEILHIVITNEYEFTRGTMGLQVPGLIVNYSKSAYLYIFLAGTLITLVVIYNLIHSNVGLNFRAVQNDERAAASLGVNVVRVRVLAFTISSGPRPSGKRSKRHKGLSGHVKISCGNPEIGFPYLITSGAGSPWPSRTPLFIILRSKSSISGFIPSQAYPLPGR